ncbi:MAG: hypothetical protein QF699_07590, partial [Candidatus Poseidoniaceae archaeon]|nr:hypothetical protein [Candidatus Poseidoniaceae archaeon]
NNSNYQHSFVLSLTVFNDTDNDSLPDSLPANYTGNLTEDFDDDNDGWSDYAEEQCLTISTDASSIPEDSDGNGICDLNEDSGSGLMPGFGALATISILSLAAFARRD